MAAVTMQLHMEGVIDLLKSLPAEIVSKRGGPVKKALRKGALVILQAEKANLNAIISEDRAKGYAEPTGLLEGSLIVTRGQPPFTGKGERYLVRVKKKVYARRGKRPVSTLKVAQLLEYGSSHQPARPFIRAAFKSSAREAIQTVEYELHSQLATILSRLAK